MKKVSLFGNVHDCEICNRTLSSDYEDTICLQCKENELFNDVREYIRANDVTEYQVAEYFEIPVRQVKKWIKEGRIEYKEFANTKIELKCVNCKEPISFGTYCQKCYKIENATTYDYFELISKDKDKMRYLDKK